MNLKKLLKKGRNGVLGLDIGSSSVKAVELEKDEGRYRLKGAAIADLADFSPRTDVDLAAVRAIRQCITATGTNKHLAVCGVSGPDVAVRCFSFPSLAGDEIEGAVRLEAEQVCPFNLENNTYDYQIVSSSEDGIKGVLVATTNNLIEKKTRLVKDASLNTVMIDAEGLALLNCFMELSNVEQGKTIAILNVGNSYANLAITGPDGFPFARDISTAGRDIIEEIAAEQKVERRMVEEMLANPGRRKRMKSRMDFEACLENACTELANDVAKTLRYYQAQEGLRAVDEMFLCGGFACAEGFIQILDSRLGCKVKKWNPFDNIERNGNTMLNAMVENRGGMMAVAAGLAMRSI